MNDPGASWTLQQIGTVAGNPWFVLQEQYEGRVVCQFTGYRLEVDSIAQSWGIEYQELSPTTDEEFLSRSVE